MIREKKVYPLIDGLSTACSYAVLANREKLSKHKHAWKVWRTLKEFGCTVYLIAPDLKSFDGFKVYPNLQSLAGKVDVVVPCLLPVELSSLVVEAQAAGVKSIWFQEQTWTQEFQAQCDEAGIQVVKGCVLLHKVYGKPFGVFNPCYWHGRQAVKVPRKK